MESFQDDYRKTDFFKEYLQELNTTISKHRIAQETYTMLDFMGDSKKAEQRPFDKGNIASIATAKEDEKQTWEAKWQKILHEAADRMSFLYNNIPFPLDTQNINTVLNQIAKVYRDITVDLTRAIQELVEEESLSNQTKIDKQKLGKALENVTRNFLFNALSTASHGNYQDNKWNLLNAMCTIYSRPEKYYDNMRTAALDKTFMGHSRAYMYYFYDLMMGDLNSSNYTRLPKYFNMMGSENFKELLLAILVDEKNPKEFAEKIRTGLREVKKHENEKEISGIMHAIDQALHQLESRIIVLNKEEEKKVYNPLTTNVNPIYDKQIPLFNKPLNPPPQPKNVPEQKMGPTAPVSEHTEGTDKKGPQQQ